MTIFPKSRLFPQPVRRVQRSTRLRPPTFHTYAKSRLFAVGRRNPAEADSSLEGTGFEPSVPPRKRRPSREAPRPTIVVSRDDFCLMTHRVYRSGISVRQKPRDPFVRAVPWSQTAVPCSVPPTTRRRASRRALRCGQPACAGQSRVDALFAVAAAFSSRSAKC
jgi:hypothetical protein